MRQDIKVLLQSRNLQFKASCTLEFLSPCAFQLICGLSGFFLRLVPFSLRNILFFLHLCTFSLSRREWNIPVGWGCFYVLCFTVHIDYSLQQRYPLLTVPKCWYGHGAISAFTCCIQMQVSKPEFCILTHSFSFASSCPFPMDICDSKGQYTGSSWLTPIHSATFKVTTVLRKCLYDLSLKFWPL